MSTLWDVAVFVRGISDFEIFSFRGGKFIGALCFVPTRLGRSFFLGSNTITSFVGVPLKKIINKFKKVNIKTIIKLLILQSKRVIYITGLIKYFN